MFLNDNDYTVAIGAKALEVIQQADITNRQKAEQMAIEEISGYLRGRYDVAAIFSATDETKNAVIVMYTADITLYHLSGSMPQKMGGEIRKERYDRAIKWLQDVQSGKIMPGLPTPTAADGTTDANNPIRFGLGQRNSYDW